jgi:anti-sigma B factor antagonist
MLSTYESEIGLYGSAGVLTVSGETDLATARQFKSDLDETMAMTHGDVVLDLSGLDLLDSTALGVMMAALGRMMGERRSLSLVVTRRHVLRVFSITGLDTMFRIVGTVDEALSPPDVRQRAA